MASPKILEFPPDLYAAVQRIAMATEIPPERAVVRSVALLELVVKELAQGRRLAILNADGSIHKEITL